jgi:hypothetical protein
MATGKQLSFGIKTAPQHTTYEDMRRIWLEADAEPLIDHAWLCWLHGTSVRKRAVCISTIFLSPHFAFVKYIELRGTSRTALPVLSEQA